MVSAEVVSSVTLEDGCRAAPGRVIDALPAGSALTTATGTDVCRFTFSASTSDASLQIYQADRTPGAMVGQPEDVENLTWSTAYFKVASAGDTIFTANEWDDNQRWSRDGGATWSPVHSPGDGLRANVSVVSSTVAWRMDHQQPETYISTNLNADPPSWVEVPTPAPGGARSLSATSVTNAWYSNFGVVGRTTDGGTTWTTFATGCFSGEQVEAVSATVAFSVGSGRPCRYRQGTDASFLAISTGLPGSFYGHVLSVSPETPTTLWFAGSEGDVYRSTNNGSSWNAVTSLPEEMTILALDSVSDSEAYAAGTDGLLYHTTDSGGSWTRIRTGLTAHITHLTAPVSGKISIAGYGVYDSTVDNGVTWTSAGVDDDGMDRITDIDSADAQLLIQGQSYGRIGVSTDGGSDWTLLPIGWGIEPVRGVTMIDDDSFIAVGDRGRIATTHDAGLTWHVRSSGTTEDLFDVDIDSQNVAIAVGANGTIVRSDNLGGTWTTEATGGRTLRKVSIISGQPAIAVGDGGTVRRSADHGLTWSSPGSGTTMDLLSISVVSPTVAYASGWNTLLTSHDGGASWTVGTLGGMSTVAAVSEHVLWASTSDISWGTWVKFSTDAGATWTAPFGGGATDAGTIHATDGGNVFIGGHGGFLRHTMDVTTLPDYASGGWDTDDSLFGACLQHASGTAAGTAWAEDLGGTTPGTCVIDEDDPWNAVPAAPVTVAEQTAAGDAVVDIVWGMQAGAALSPGRYTAGIVVQAIAP